MRASSIRPAISSSDNTAVDRNEEQLVAEAKSGSHAAFEKLVECYRTRIFRMAHTAARSYEDAEDVIQQSFHKAFVHLRSFEGRSSFSTWLTRIALNEVLMLRRSKRRFRHVSIDDSSAAEDVAPALEIPDSRPNPEHSCSQRERRRLLLSAMNELKPGIRMALQMRELEQRSAVDTARILGVSVSAVKSRVCRGRRALRKKLKNRYGSAIARETRQREFQSVDQTPDSHAQDTADTAPGFRRSLVGPPDAKRPPVTPSDCFASTSVA